MPVCSYMAKQHAMTPGVQAVAPDFEQWREWLRRHYSGDFGVIDPEDRETNLRAIRDGERVMSAYPIDPDQPCAGHGDNCVWVITEADRSVTTLLLPEEY